MSSDWRLIYERRAWDELQRLSEDLRSRIVEALEDFAATGRGNTRKLEGRFPPVFRLRIGDFRALFVYERQPDGSTAIIVKRVPDRKNAY